MTLGNDIYKEPNKVSRIKKRLLDLCHICRIQATKTYNT